MYTILKHVLFKKTYTFSFPSIEKILNEHTEWNLIKLVAPASAPGNEGKLMSN